MSAYKSVERKNTLADLISGGYGDISSLKDELDEMLGNMEEKLSQTSRYQALESARDELENMCEEPNIPECLGEHGKLKQFHTKEIKWHEQVGKRKNYSPSRVTRLGNAGAMLEAACDALRCVVEDGIKNQEIADEIQELIDKLDEDSQNVQGVEIPGMYG